ncbi:hypothetical protein HC031_26375 [Planosporangium thailandense]|uniref:Excreted virulence factor EspC (Type VII ESX diderm) n=1 Tax=Planosporangium thailandense TaxID=765197 RepID=A0ABX0Y4A6_9ACTN|nr:type VII secretion target [Planosporangium thailandense]NJC73217.1 hypothetical protein [Planosporangium thailandense]
MGSNQEVQVVTDALHAEAAKWRRLAGDMDAVRGNASRLELSNSAFFIGDLVSTVAHSAAYNEFRTYMVHLFSGAVTEFDQLGAALDKAADLYDASDGQAVTDLTQIYGH